jgi:hypothetical protein
MRLCAARSALLKYSAISKAADTALLRLFCDFPVCGAGIDLRGHF